MAKKVTGFVKLQVPAGQANPAPPVGPALGRHGVNIMEFVKQFNARTQSQMGMIIPVEITVYADRSFTFITKTPPAANLLMKAAGSPKGSGTYASGRPMCSSNDSGTREAAARSSSHFGRPIPEAACAFGTLRKRS